MIRRNVTMGLHLVQALQDRFRIVLPASCGISGAESSNKHLTAAGKLQRFLGVGYSLLSWTCMSQCPGVSDQSIREFRYAFKHALIGGNRLIKPAHLVVTPAKRLHDAW